MTSGVPAPTPITTLRRRQYPAEMKIGDFLSSEEWPEQDAFFEAYRERVLPAVRG